MTPEGRIKAKIKRYLGTLMPSVVQHGEVYYEMPVPTGYGKSGLDYTICFYGHFVSIEAKAPGEWLTPRQRDTAHRILMAGGSVFIISSDEGLQSFIRWVEKCRKDFAVIVDTNSKP